MAYFDFMAETDVRDFQRQPNTSALIFNLWITAFFIGVLQVFIHFIERVKFSRAALSGCSLFSRQTIGISMLSSCL